MFLATLGQRLPNLAIWLERHQIRNFMIIVKYISFTVSDGLKRSISLRYHIIFDSKFFIWATFPLKLVIGPATLGSVKFPYKKSQIFKILPLDQKIVIRFKNTIFGSDGFR